VPLRDDRRGRRATIGSGTAPLRPEFKPLNGDAPLVPGATAHVIVVDDAGAENAIPEHLGGNHIATHDLRANVIDSKAIDPNAPNGNAGAKRGGVSLDVEPPPPPAPAETQRQSLLEPSAALTAIARPFRAARSAWLTFLHLSTQGNGNAEPIDGGAVAEDDVLVERSFGSVVASLLRAPLDYAPRDGSIRENAPADLAEPPTAYQTPLTENGNDGDSARPTERKDLDLNTPTKTVADSRYPAADDSDESRHPVIHERDDSFLDSQHRVTPGLTASQEPASHEKVATAEHAAQQNFVVASAQNYRGERIIPLTRLPLRPQGFAITWTAALAEFEVSRAPSREQRHGVLERLVREPASVSSDIIARAYHEEDGEGRAIALRVLLRNFPEAGRLAFIEALRIGSDEERAIAVDGLTAIGAREELTPAFADRVDAIAAKAALAYVGTFTRADYANALSAYIDRARIDTILHLLAGIVE
jgi:hypothetical protein